jgi:hypothetical protein
MGLMVLHPRLAEAGGGQGRGGLSGVDSRRERLTAKRHDCGGPREWKMRWHVRSSHWHPCSSAGLACIGPNSCTKLQIDVQMFRIAALQQSFALQNPTDDLPLHFAMHLQNPMFLGRWSTM